MFCFIKKEEIIETIGWKSRVPDEVNLGRPRLVVVNRSLLTPFGELELLFLCSCDQNA